MGITLGELLTRLNIKGEYSILAAYVNNRLKELNSRLFKPAVVRFIDITHFEGYRVYQRTISFILHKAVWDLYRDRKFYIRHSLGRGFYCEFDDGNPITDEEIEALIAERQAARKAKNFARADEIRNELLDKGIILEDTREGVKWKRA